MTETSVATTTPGNAAEAGKMANIVYVLYLVALFLGITGIVGVVIAYVNKDDAPDWVRSHYQFQIRTFWIGGLFILIGSVTAMVLVGYLVLLAWVVWLIIRTIKGMKYLNKGEAHPNPTTWVF
jgi:uncharacterized membrane protein